MMQNRENNGHSQFFFFFFWDTLNKKGCSDYLGYHFSIPVGPTGLMRFDGEIHSAMLGSNWKYGPHAAATHLDYMVEFTVTVPILSLAGTMDNLPVGEQWL